MDVMRPYEDRLLLQTPTAHSKPSWFGFVITVRDNAGFTRADLVRFLEANRVETRSLFAGNLLRHPAFQAIPHRIVRDLANTDTVMNNTFFVGVYPGLDAARLDHMAAAFDSFMSGDRVAAGLAVSACR
jgi:CDP-6-deoxy-D-xylo-4-hexulose-3-dehydrase